MRKATFGALALLAALAFPANGHAQIIDHFGAKVGVASASAADNLDQLDRRAGLTASVFAERRLLPFLSLVGEIGYAQRGFAETLQRRSPDGERTGILEAHTRLDYLTIPLMARLDYNFSPAALYALAGPRFDVLLNRKAGTFEYSGGTIESGIAENYSSPAIGATLGIGVSTQKLLPVRLLLESRYAFDLTDSFANAPRDIRNNAITFVVGVAF